MNYKNTTRRKCKQKEEEQKKEETDKRRKTYTNKYIHIAYISAFVRVNRERERETAETS